MRGQAADPGYRGAPAWTAGTGTRPCSPPTGARSSAPALGPAASVPAAGQALRRHRRHRRPHDLKGSRRPARGKGEDGRARTRKDGLTVFFTQDKLNKDGRPTGSWTCSTPASTSTTSPGKLEFILLDRKDEWLAARLEDPGYDYFEPNAQ